MYNVIASVKYRQAETNVIKTLSAGGPGTTEAVAALAARAAKIVGTKIGTVTIKARLSAATVASDYPTHGASGHYEAAKLGMVRLSSGVVIDTAERKLPALSTAYADTSAVGQVLLSDADIIAIATTHYDTNGNAGFTLVSGGFTD